MKPYSDLAKIIHREGYIFIIIFAVITFVLGSFSTTFGWIGTISTLWCAYFFRNPERVTPVNDNFIISPADGIVQAIKEGLEERKESKMEAKEGEESEA